MKLAHPNSLANLQPFNSDRAREGQKAAVKSRLLNSELQNQFRITAQAFLRVKEQLPEITALDVIKLAMWQALQDDNYEDASRYAEKIAEYEQPKLQRIDQITTTRTVDLTDEELLEIIKNEGLSINEIK